MTMQQSSTFRSRCGPARAGFSLLELLMVLSIIVVMGGLAWPRISGLLRQQQLRGSAEEVRRFLDHARVRAIEEGRTLEVRIEPNGRRYISLPHDPPNPLQGQSLQERMGQAPVERGRQQEPFRILELSAACSFYVPNALLGDGPGSERIQEKLLEPVLNGFAGRDLTWTTPILFYPDGTATDGKVTVMDQNRRYVNLFVRGLTGATSAAPPRVLTESIGVAAP